MEYLYLMFTMSRSRDNKISRIRSKTKSKEIYLSRSIVDGLTKLVSLVYILKRTDDVRRCDVTKYFFKVNILLVYLVARWLGPIV